MKNPLLISGLLLCVAAAPLASAQQGPAARGAFGLLQHDANQDGQLTFEEYNSSIQQQFARIDADGNGTSTPQEREAAREQLHAERLNARFAALDTNGDGNLSVEEYSARPERSAQTRRVRADRAPGNGPRRMGRNGRPDAAADISYTDFSSRRIERFEAVDQNGDRTLTQDELHAAANAPRPGRR